MKILTHSNIRFFIVLFSFSLTGYGWAIQNIDIAIIGAITYLTAIVYDLVDLIVNSKKFKKSEETITTQNPIEKFTLIIESVLVISALIAIIPKDNLYRTPGSIIWFGQVIAFALVGPIIEIFAKIPMKMTFGGWRVRSFLKNRK